ncbi:MAG: ATP-dependent helicase HrpB [Proteobacteria bacterium]|nr:MAG: ATP-dependent helicase HrpB [Pseudomonadota bacterium]
MAARHPACRAHDGGGPVPQASTAGQYRRQGPQQRARVSPHEYHDANAGVESRPVSTSNSPLPITAVLPELLAALEATRNVVLQAPPGAGKSTGVPLALLDAPWLAGRKIVMLEPRRLAARAVAARMAQTLQEPLGATVGYRTRLDSRVSAATRIEVVTEGILTRWLQRDPALEGVAAVIFDEFHERSLQADLGLALCLDVQDALREDLRLLVMSATLDGQAVARLLGDAPLVTAQGRRFPVDIHWSAARPAGQEMDIAQRVARTALRALAEAPGDVLAFLPGQGEIRRTQRILEDSALPPGTRVLPLYGDLPPEQQDAAVRPGATGQRKIVLATNIAETSLTIEGVRIVIDSGLARRARFDPATGMSRLDTVRISQASAAQRCGRAGRLDSGVCYRLWTESEHALLPAQTPPEIAEADLAPLALELANWGSPDPAALRWLDAPPAAAFAQARDLLHALDAVDARGRITPHGRALARLATHPRLAHMIVRGETLGLATLAIHIAALLGERDLLRPRGAERDIDLRHRVEVLRDPGAAPAGFTVDSGARQRAQRTVGQLERQLAVRQAADRADPDRDTGRLLALAYPDRIAHARTEARSGEVRYLLSGGRGARLSGPQSLAKSEFLVVADLDAGAREAQIRLAAPIERSALLSDFAERIVERERIEWDPREQAVVMRRERWLGALKLEERRLEDADPARVSSALLDGIRTMGLEALPWTREARAWLDRVRFVARAMPEEAEMWPDVSDANLLATLEHWLAPWLEGMSRRDHLQQLDLLAALRALLDWNGQQRLDALAPTHLTVPSGSRIPIDYSACPPTLSVRLQELFGLTETPTVAGGCVPLTIELLSPARRPVQVTQDLKSFWARGYPEVKKELKGRYPKHYWPDDPLAAEPTARAKRRG